MKTISQLSLLAVLLVVLTGAAVAKPGKSVKRMAKPIAGSYAVILADTIRDEPEFILDDLAKRQKAHIRAYLTPLIKGGHFEMTEAQAYAMLRRE